jgi:glycosyltransferase involved in cell wall biosynthesis
MPRRQKSRPFKALLFANTDWYLFNFRLPLARQLRASGFDVVLVSPPGAYGSRLRQAGFRWQPLAMDRRSLNPWHELSVVARLARLYRRERPDIIHNFTIKCAVYGAIAAALAGVPARVHTVAGLGYVFTNPAPRARLLRPCLWALIRRALNSRRSRLILQNADDMAAFEKTGIADPRTMRLIKGSGVDTCRFRPGSEPALSGGTTRVLLASRLLWDKGIAEFVEAARALRHAGMPIRFVLAGAPDPGNPASIPQQQLDAWAGESVVELLGHVDDMPELLARTDIAVLPSHREGLPRSLIEAAACGLPLVTTDVPGCRDVVTDRVNGLVVPVRHAEALAAAIRALHDNPEWARTLGRAARLRALAEFDECIVLSQTLDVYAELLPELKRDPAWQGNAQTRTADASLRPMPAEF